MYGSVPNDELQLHAQRKASHTLLLFGQGCMKSAACWQAERCCCLLARSSGWQLWSLLACLLCCCPLQVDYDLLDTLITHIDSTQGPGAILVFLPGVHMCGYPQMSSYSCMWPLPG